jgi:hypothetical protein
MKSDFCEFEETLTSALLAGRWDDSLERHAATCSHCGDLLLVWQYLGAASEQTAPLPAAGLIWWRSQLAERREHAERAVAAIDLMQRFAVAVALIAATVCAAVWRGVDWNVVVLGAALLVCTGIVLYGWVRGRI